MARNLIIICPDEMRVSLMTGRYTHVGGYQRALFGKDHCWGAERVARDFDFTSHAGPLAHHMEGVPALSDDRKTDQAVAFLTSARDRSRPFFMQVNIESPDPVYGVERESAEIQRVYYGMISKVDFLVGRILDAIESEGLWDDTVVLFWSDHGDYAGQYGLAEKWDTSFADCLVKVPCILVAPGTEPWRDDKQYEWPNGGRPRQRDLHEKPIIDYATGKEQQ